MMRVILGLEFKIFIQDEMEKYIPKKIIFLICENYVA